jgi:hypothetical protein
LSGLIIASYTAKRVPAELAPWFWWRPLGGAEAFERAWIEWSSLVEAEARWRGRFPSYREGDWPTPDELLAAATLAEKRGLAAIFRAVGGGSRILVEMAERLGLPANTKIAGEDLEGLAAHAQALAAFLENRTYQQMLGSAWAGLDTPFEVIGRAFKFSATARGKITEFPHGRRVCELLDELDSKGIERLGQTFSTLDDLRQFSRQAARTTLRPCGGAATCCTSPATVMFQLPWRFRSSSRREPSSSMR